MQNEDIHTILVGTLLLTCQPMLMHITNAPPENLFVLLAHSVSQTAAD